MPSQAVYPQRLMRAIKSGPVRLAPCIGIGHKQVWFKIWHQRLHDHISDGLGVVRDLLVSVFGNDETVTDLRAKFSRDGH